MLLGTRIPGRWAIIFRAFSPLNRERRVGFVSPSRPSFESILPELKTFLPSADFVIEGSVDPSSLCYDVTSPLGEPKHGEGFFVDHTGYYKTPEPYPVLLPSLFPGILGA